MIPLKLSLQNAVRDPIAEFTWAVLAAQNPSMSSTTRMKLPFVILYNTISSYSLPLAQRHAYLSQLQTGFRPVCDPTITTSSKDIADVPILSVVFPIQPVPPFCGICLSIPKRRNKNRGYKWENQMAGTAWTNPSLSTLICWKMAFT